MLKKVIATKIEKKTSKNKLPLVFVTHVPTNNDAFSDKDLFKENNTIVLTDNSKQQLFGIPKGAVDAEILKSSMGEFNVDDRIKKMLLRDKSATFTGGHPEACLGRTLRIAANIVFQNSKDSFTAYLPENKIWVDNYSYKLLSTLTGRERKTMLKVFAQKSIHRVHKSIDPLPDNVRIELIDKDGSKYAAAPWNNEGSIQILTIQVI